MPYKSEKIKIQGTMLDRRKKLTDNDRSKIVDLYKTTGISIHSLAKEFNVSRRTIQLVLFPDRLEKAKQRIKEHWRDYANREKLTIAIRNTRRYKQKLYLDKKIGENKNAE